MVGTGYYILEDQHTSLQTLYRISHLWEICNDSKQMYK
jgi:hypothetical protein